MSLVKALPQSASAACTPSLCLQIRHLQPRAVLGSPSGQLSMGRTSLHVCICLLLVLCLQQAAAATSKKAVTRIAIQKHQPAKRSHAGVQASNDGDSVKLLNYLDAQVCSATGQAAWEGCMGCVLCCPW
jgi:hypothetical protein